MQMSMNVFGCGLLPPFEKTKLGITKVRVGVANGTVGPSGLYGPHLLVVTSNAVLVDGAAPDTTQTWNADFRWWSGHALHGCWAASPPTVLCLRGLTETYCRQ